MHIGINACFWSRATTGTGQYLHHLVSALPTAAPGLQLDLLAAAALTPADPALQRSATPLDRLGDNAAKLWFEQIAFPKLCARLGCDVAHVPYFAAPWSHAVPVVVTIHDLIPLILPAYRGGLSVRAYTRLVARAAARADLVLTDSQASAGDILRLLPVARERLCVVPLAAEERYRPLSDAERAPVLARLGVERPYVLYLGGFDQRKRVPLLIEAFRPVAAAADLTLVIAGRLPASDSAFAPDPRPLAQRLGLADRVRFLGEVAEEDKPALYSGALAFAFPSSYEGFGLPVLEALSCGTPAVIAAGSSLAEVAGPGGLAIAPTAADSAAAWAAALLRLAREPALRAELAQAGLAHAARFSWARVAAETLAAYEQARQLHRVGR